MKTSSQARFYGIGAIIYSFVSLLWLAIAYFIGTTQNSAIIAIGVIAVAVLLFVAIRFIMQAPAATTDKDDKTGMWFGIIFAWEGIGIGVVSGILVALELTQWIPIAVVIIVGLHFFPLGRLLAISTDYIIGSLLLLIGILTPMFVDNSSEWVSVVSLSTALVLYIAGWSRIRAGRQLMTLD